MDLKRVVLTLDGVIKANFDDGSIFVLSASASNFVVWQGGERQRQMTQFALSRHSAGLAMVLEFRNKHVDRPFFCSKLMPSSREGMTLGYRLSDIWWPSTASDALAKGLVHVHEDGQLAVSAEDSAGRIVLHQHRRRMAVCYPLLVRDNAQEGTYQYIWQTQVFSLLAHPPRWDAAVELLIQVSQQLEARQEEQSATLLDHPAQSHDAVVGGRQGPGAARRTELPHALAGNQPGFHDNCPSEGWWSEQTLALFPDSETAILEWTPQATYQFHPESGEVEVWVHDDDSCLSSLKQGRFVIHHRKQLNGAPSEQMYAAHCVPESVWGTGSRCALAAIAAHATKFRQQMAASLSTSGHGAAARKTQQVSCITGRQAVAQSLPLGQPSSTALLGLTSMTAQETFAVTSKVVLEQASIPGEGEFFAFADGRLRISFVDRTILHMNAAGTFCKVVLPDGASLMVAVTQPVGVAAYVKAALAFAAWAFKSPEQRVVDFTMQARAQAELNILHRMNCMLDWPSKQQQQPESGVSCVDASAHVQARNTSSRPERLVHPGFLPRDIEAMLKKNQELVSQL